MAFWLLAWPVLCYFTDDLTWSNHINVMTLTGCAYCTRLFDCLLDLYYVILHNISAIVHHIMGCINFLGFLFLTLGRQALDHWYFCGGAYGLQFVGLRYFLASLGATYIKMSPNCPDDFLICSHRYSPDFIEVSCRYFEFCVRGLQVFATHVA